MQMHVILFFYFVVFSIYVFLCNQFQVMQTENIQLVLKTPSLYFVAWTIWSNRADLLQRSTYRELDNNQSGYDFLLFYLLSKDVTALVPHPFVCPQIFCRMQVFVVYNLRPGHNFSQGKDSWLTKTLNSDWIPPVNKTFRLLVASIVKPRQIKCLFFHSNRMKHSIPSLIFCCTKHYF